MLRNALFGIKVVNNIDKKLLNGILLLFCFESRSIEQAGMMLKVSSHSSDVV